MSNHEVEERDHLAGWVSWSLLIGVTLSGIVLATGLLLDPTRSVHEQAGQSVSIPDILKGSAHQDGVPMINLGLLLLMATPVLRIMVLGLGWMLKGKIGLVAVALGVLLLLLASMLLGIG